MKEKRVEFLVCTAANSMRQKDLPSCPGALFEGGLEGAGTFFGDDFLQRNEVEAAGHFR